ncbi:CapA family protein [Bacillus sp. Marseille-P3661]|uniref:CapA family protein n=1 Tax=Bacillus sp. Marseille-P3661 TaxID=1936234 RepID=UPI000C845E4A|nr:CapA family protein [Bacillus sp. Marseille-P3661]
MKTLKIKMYVSMIITTLLFLTCFMLIQMYLTQSQSVSGQSTANKVAFEHTPKPLSSLPLNKTVPVKSTATLVGIGDILIHGTVYKDARLQDGSYDFTHMLESVSPYIESADIAFANQETVIGGSEIGLSTYPRFNSPFEVGDALKKIGIDVVSMANNHTLDRGEEAIRNAINYWNKLGITYVGSYLSEEDQQTIRVIQKNDISFSFLAYTYGTNGIPVPKGKEYLVNLINTEKIKEEINRAKSLSDVVVVSLHFGNEYIRLPNEQQKQLVKELVNAGANIILGHHPHVLQPTEWVTSETGNKAFVIYSLGNFLSGQKELYREIGGIIQLEIEKTRNGNHTSIIIKNPAFLPTYVVKTGSSNFKVIPLKNAGKSPSIYDDITAHMKQWVPDLEILQ